MTIGNSDGIKLPVKIIAIFSIGLCIVGVSYLLRRESASTTNVLQINNKFNLQVADTESERIQGLSGRGKLDKDAAMLFVFPESAEQCMWMKDMKFSLDMVWLNASKKITKIERNISPNTYPQAFCGQRAKYVLEFNAGVTDDIGLKIGQNLNF